MEGTPEGNVSTITNKNNVGIKLEQETIFKSSSTTQFKTIKLYHKWSIYNFRDFYNKRGSKFQSSIFSDGTKDGLKWRLEIDPQGCSTRSDYYLIINLVLVSKIFDELKAAHQIHISDGTKILKTSKNENAIFTNSSNCWPLFYIYTTENIFKEHLLPDNKFTVLCEIEILNWKTYDNISIPVALTNDLGVALFENPDLSVVTFSVSGKELQALKAILVARSPVFKAMFSHDMQERKNSRIEITDIDYEVLKEMLRFIYTNEISNLDNIADRLLIAADKYALESLKRRCEESMIRNLSIENAAQYFVLADQHNLKELKMRAKSFIVANAKDVAETFGLKSVVGELFLAILDRQS